MKTVDITYRYGPPDAASGSRPSNSETALRRLNDGNRAFAALLDGLSHEGGGIQRIIPVDANDLGLSPGDKGLPTQHPFAAILGCSDARVPIELVFNEGPNDLFIIRVAGNSLGADVLGSLKFAVDHLSESLKLIAVLGHSGCGAITAAVDVFLDPAEYLPLASKHSLRNVIDGLLIVVQASAKKIHAAFGADISRHAGYRQALIEASIATHAALAAYSIQQELRAGLQVVYGVYLLETREVWTPQVNGQGVGLAAAPRDAAEFTELGDAIVRSDRISALIKTRD